MEYVHRCIVCDWQRSAASPTVTSPRCGNCGCALESVHASDVMALDGHGDVFQVPERVRRTVVRFGAVAGTLLLVLAAARTGYTEGGLAIAVSAVGIAGLVVVMAMTAERA
jgi:general stress protein CsbA